MEQKMDEKNVLEKTQLLKKMQRNEQKMLSDFKEEKPNEVL